MANESSVVGIYAHIDQAEEAVQKLGQGGFPIQHVSIIARDLGTEKKIHGFVTPCDVAKSSARTGAWSAASSGCCWARPWSGSRGWARWSWPAR